jgi:hypothetical protein
MFPKSCSIANGPRRLVTKQMGTKSSETSHDVNSYVIILEDITCTREGWHRRYISEVGSEGEQFINQWLESRGAFLSVESGREWIQLA